MATKQMTAAASTTLRRSTVLSTAVKIGLDGICSSGAGGAAFVETVTAENPPAVVPVAGGSGSGSGEAFFRRVSDSPFLLFSRRI
jgi:hypothetical protein